MNLLYEKAKDVVLIRRTSDNKEFEEYSLILRSQCVLMTDCANDIVLFPVCGLSVAFAVSSSHAETSSYAFLALSASYALSSSYAQTSSYSFIAQVALESSGAVSASYALSASYAQSASYGTNFFAPRVTSSYVSASVAMQTNQLTASNVLVSGMVFGSASYALNALTASEADFARVASSSISVLGLNVITVPPMPNNQIVFGVGSSTPAVFQAVTTIDGAIAEGQTHALTRIPDNNKIYGGGWYGTLYVFNDPDGDFSNVTSCSFNAGNFISQMVYASGSLYVINSSNVGTFTGSITRVNINDITQQTVIVQGLTGGSQLASMTTDGNYLFVITGNSIRKYNLSGSLVQSTSAVSGSGTVTYCHASTISSDKQWAYFSTTNGAIFKVKCSDVTNYTASARIQDPFNFDASLTDDMCYLNGYLYCTVESDAGLFKVNATDLTYTSYPAAFNSFGVFTDGTNIYLMQGSEIWVYLNANLDDGPIRFGVAGTANEFAITAAGRIVYSAWTTLNLYSYILPITELGINKFPEFALDVAGVINADLGITTTTVSASTSVSTGTTLTAVATIYNTLTLDDAAFIRGSSPVGILRIDSGSVRAPTISSSAALVGKVFNTRFSQSFAANATMSFTQSLGTLSFLGEGMYRIVVAGTIGFYSGSTIVTPPSWSFVHTDRLGTYLMPSTPPVTYAITPAGYDQGYAFSGEYVFQAVASTPVAYYYSSNFTAVSSTDCSASFFTSVTLAQIMSGSVTGSI